MSERKYEDIIREGEGKGILKEERQEGILSERRYEDIIREGE